MVRRTALTILGGAVGMFAVLGALQACKPAGAANTNGLAAAEPPAVSPPAPRPAVAADPAYEKFTKVLTYAEAYSVGAPSRVDAATALGLLGDQRAVPLLIEHLENTSNGMLRRQLLKSLSWLGGDTAVAALERALQDKDPHTRSSAARALKHATGKDYEFDRTGLPDPDKLLETLKAAREARERAK